MSQSYQVPHHSYFTVFLLSFFFFVLVQFIFTVFLTCSDKPAIFLEALFFFPLSLIWANIPIFILLFSKDFLISMLGGGRGISRIFYSGAFTDCYLRTRPTSDFLMPAFFAPHREKKKNDHNQPNNQPTHESDHISSHQTEVFYIVKPCSRIGFVQ